MIPRGADRDFARAARTRGYKTSPLAQSAHSLKYNRMQFTCTLQIDNDQTVNANFGQTECLTGRATVRCTCARL